MKAETVGTRIAGLLAQQKPTDRLQKGVMYLGRVQGHCFLSNRRGNRDGRIGENRYVYKWKEGKLRNFSPDALFQAQPSSDEAVWGGRCRTALWPGAGSSRVEAL